MIYCLLPCLLLLIGNYAAPTPEKSYPVPNPLNGTCVYDGLAMADPHDETVYYQCCQYMWFFKTCEEGSIFDKLKLICVPNDSKPSSQSRKLIAGTCQESMEQDGFKANSQNCRTYFQCDQGEWKLRYCESGTQWVQSVLGCDNHSESC